MAPELSLWIRWAISVSIVTSWFILVFRGGLVAASSNTPWWIHRAADLGAYGRRNVRESRRIGSGRAWASSDDCIRDEIAVNLYDSNQSRMQRIYFDIPLLLNVGFAAVAIAPIVAFGGLATRFEWPAYWSTRAWIAAAVYMVAPSSAVSCGAVRVFRAFRSTKNCREAKKELWIARARIGLISLFASAVYSSLLISARPIAALSFGWYLALMIIIGIVAFLGYASGSVLAFGI